MRRNRRAVTRTPLADSWYSEPLDVVAIFKALPENGPLTRVTMYTEREHYSERLKFRTRNRVRLTERAIPRADDRTPGDERRVTMRRERKGETLNESRRAIVLGATLIRGIENKNAFESVFPEWSTVPHEPSTVLVKRKRKRAALKLASEEKRRANEKRERVRMRKRSKETRARKLALEAAVNATFRARPLPSTTLATLAPLMVVGW